MFRNKRLNFEACKMQTSLNLLFYKDSHIGQTVHRIENIIRRMSERSRGKCRFIWRVSLGKKETHGNLFA